MFTTRSVRLKELQVLKLGSFSDGFVASHPKAALPEIDAELAKLLVGLGGRVAQVRVRRDVHCRGRGHNLNGFTGFYLKAKAIIWP